jgi:transposase
LSLPKRLQFCYHLSNQLDTGPSPGIECSRFAWTVRNDLAAVRNAIRYAWSNGQTEGQINRLKTLKRQMYGRAGIDLLRARLLPLAEYLQPTN